MVKYLKENFFVRYRPVSTASPRLISYWSSGWLTLPTGGNFASSGRHRNTALHAGTGASAAVAGYGLRYQLLRYPSCLLDGYIEVGGNRYSVPESLCGQPVSIRISLDDELRIYSNEQQMASHRLCSAASGWQTVPEHHAPLWQQVSQVEPEI